MFKMNVASRILSAVPVTGPLGLDNVVLSLDSKMTTPTRITSGVLLALKLTALILAIVFLTMKRPGKHFYVHECKYSWEAAWSSKEFRTWYNQEYETEPTTKTQANLACEKYGDYVRDRENQLNSRGQIMLMIIGALWIAGIVVAFRAKRVE